MSLFGVQQADTTLLVVTISVSESLVRELDTWELERWIAPLAADAAKRAIAKKDAA